MPHFRTATITLGFDTGSAGGGLLVTPQGVFTTNSLPLRRLISYAYGLQDPTITGPPMLDSEPYSITAQPEKVPVLPEEIDQFRPMVQALLADSFGLEFHWETRPTRALALRHDGDTTGLKRAASTDPGPLLQMRSANSIRVGNASLEPLFISWLSSRLGLPIVDETELIDTYNFELTWGGDEPGDRANEALQLALEVQLGLTLASIEIDIEHMIVDRLERPADLEPAPVAADVDPEILDHYVGHYRFGAKTMTISRDGDGLVSRLEGQSPIEIFPVSKTEFFAKLIPARFEFRADTSGHATTLVLRQGGREIHGHRLTDEDS